MDMMYLAIAFIAGLVVGWNFLPQPAFVKNIVDQLGLTKKDGE